MVLCALKGTGSLYFYKGFLEHMLFPMASL